VLRETRVESHALALALDRDTRAGRTPAALLEEAA